jgi:RNA polymerase sigma factor (sigma-70 family)
MEDPVTQWMQQLQSGSPEAARKIWEHYCRKLYSFARKRLPPQMRRSYDEEDVALSAFHSICEGIKEGRFPELSDRDNLWRLMLTITVRKIAIRHRYDHRDKRDASKLMTESGLFANAGRPTAGMDALPAAEPTPEFAAEMAETCNSLFCALSDDNLRQIAQLKMEGFTNGEIAKQLSVTRRTIERKLERIRREWSEFLGIDSAPE